MGNKNNRPCAATTPANSLCTSTISFVVPFVDGNSGGAITPTSGNFQMTLSRNGNQVTMYMPYTAFINTSPTPSNYIIAPANTIPQQYLPTIVNNTALPVLTTVGGTHQTGRLFINSDGSFGINANSNSTSPWATQNEIDGIGSSWIAK